MYGYASQAQRDMEQAFHLSFVNDLPWFQPGVVYRYSMASHLKSIRLFTLSYVFFLGLRLCVCSLWQLSGADILRAVESSCVVVVTEEATPNVYNLAQYLADVTFRHEPGVLIGRVSLVGFTWGSGQRLTWRDGSGRAGKTDLVYFPRRVRDRTCLLTTAGRWAPLAGAVPGSRDETSLADTVNRLCNTYRTVLGHISADGLHRQYILQNLFFVEDVSDTTMGSFFGVDSASGLSRHKGDNSACYVNSSRFYYGEFDHDLAVNSHRMSVQRGPTLPKHVNIRIPQCEVIDVPQNMDFFENYLRVCKPVIIRDALRHWPALRRWTNQFLREKFGSVKVHVKLSPSGEYEGVEPAREWEDHDNFSIPGPVRSQLPYPDLVVVRPATINLDFAEFLDMIEGGSNGSVKNVSAYLEYTSLAEYFAELLGDIAEMPFIRSVLRLAHRNVWLSDGNTLGKMHFDPFDNFLCQISGEKELTLFSPHDNTRLYEAHIPEAILGFNRNTNRFRRKTLLDSTSMVMSPVDIEAPDFKRFPQFADAAPLRCTVKEGQALYLPAFWWHEVQSRPSRSAHRNLAVNFWYKPFLTREFPCPECKLDVNPEYRHLLHDLPK